MTETLRSQRQPLAVLYQLLAALAGTVIGSWLMFSTWVSSINDYAWKVGALEGSLPEMWAEVSDLVRLSTIIAGLACGLWAVVAVRSRFWLNLDMESSRVKALIAVALIFSLLACVMFVFAIGVIA